MHRPYVKSGLAGMNIPVTGALKSPSSKVYGSARSHLASPSVGLALDRPAIAMMSGVSWSIVSDSRSSRARFAAFWLSTPHRK
jgi:hypothetical protein